MRKDRVSVATETRRRRILVLVLIVTFTLSLGSVVMAQTSKSTAVKNIVVVHEPLPTVPGGKEFTRF